MVDGRARSLSLLDATSGLAPVIQTSLEDGRVFSDFKGMTVLKGATGHLQPEVDVCENTGHCEDSEFNEVPDSI